MADNVEIKDASDVTVPVASDDVGGIQFQRVKLDIGGDGASSPVTSGNPMPVSLNLAKAEDSPSADGDLGIVVLAQRRDTDATAVSADGDYTTLKSDEEGRLKVSTKPASYPDITGDITAIQASIGTPVAGGTVAGDVSRASNVMAFCTGTFSTINCTFEGSLQGTGDTNWFAIQAVRSNANTIETTTGNLSAQPAYAWEMSVNALRRVRVRCTARTSGTQSWRFVQGTYATEPIPAAQVSGTQPVSGTVTANIGTGSIASGTNAIGDVGGAVRTGAGGMALTKRLLSAAASTNTDFAKNGAGRLYKIRGYNASASVRWFKLYNKASAPTIGTDVPVMTLALAPTQVFDIDFESIGYTFTTGIAYAITTGSADADAGALTAGDILGLNVIYA